MGALVVTNAGVGGVLEAILLEAITNRPVLPPVEPLTSDDEAWRRIEAGAKKFGVELEEKSWRELFAGSKAQKKR